MSLSQAESSSAFSAHPWTGPKGDCGRSLEVDEAITVSRNWVKMLVILSCVDLSSTKSEPGNYSLRNEFQVSPHSSPSLATKLEIKSKQAFPAKHPSDSVKHIQSR